MELFNLLGCKPQSDSNDSKATSDTADSTSSDCPTLSTADLYNQYDQDGDGYLSIETPECLLAKILSGEIEVDAETFDHVLDGEWDGDDADSTIYPGAPELCDGLDNDEDGEIDEDPVEGQLYYRDADVDGYGDATVAVLSCDAPEGYVADALDCDDADASVHPDVTEVCGNGVNEDCSAEPAPECRVGDVRLEDAVAKISGTTDNRQMGEAFAPAGDLNDDGFNDLVVGVPQKGVASDYGYALVFNGQSDLAAVTDSFVVLRGPKIADSTGFAVLMPGDVDGDGYGDLMVSRFLDDTNGVEAGAVELVYGPVVNGTIGVLNGVSLYGQDTNQGFGASLLSVGDLNSDGRAEVVVGSLGSDDVGFFSIYTDAPSTSVAAEYVGQAGEKFGGNGAVADLDGDGILDLIAGAPQASGAAEASGVVYIFLDLQTLPTITTANADAKIDGGLVNAKFGNAVSTGISADYDGDGLPDVAVGEPGNSATATLSGAAYVFLSPPSSQNSNDARLQLQGQAAYGELGTAVSLASFDGNQQADLFAGVPAASTLSATGEVWQVYAYASGVATSSNATWVGFNATDRAGFTLQSLGDVDGDGDNEMAVGAPYANRLESKGGVAAILGGFGE